MPFPRPGPPEKRRLGGPAGGHHPDGPSALRNLPTRASRPDHTSCPASRRCLWWVSRSCSASMRPWTAPIGPLLHSTRASARSHLGAAAGPGHAVLPRGWLVLLGLVRRVGCAHQSHAVSSRSWWAQAGLLIVLVALWLPVRAALLIAMLLHRALRTEYDTPLALMNQFWNPWVHLALLAIPVLLVIRFVTARLDGSAGWAGSMEKMVGTAHPTTPPTLNWWVVAASAACRWLMVAMAYPRVAGPWPSRWCSQGSFCCVSRGCGTRPAGAKRVGSWSMSLTPPGSDRPALRHTVVRRAIRIQLRLYL